MRRPAFASNADFPARVFPDTALWSESYALWCWDDANDLSLYAHFQRHPQHPALWRSTIVLTRTDHVYALNTYGPQATPFGPGIDAAHIVVEQPHQRWRLRVNAAAHQQTLKQHMMGGITDGPATPLGINLHLDFRSPVWALGAHDAKATMASSEHYEQTGVVSGVVELGAETFSVSCLGANDHSRGVRDFGALRTGGFFLPAVFPSGRCLTASRVSGAPDAATTGYLHLGDGRLSRSRDVVGPLSLPIAGAPVPISVSAEDGVHANITVTPKARRLFMSIIPPNFERIGLIRGADSDFYYCDWSCSVEWDGEIGVGSLQMCHRSA